MFCKSMPLFVRTNVSNIWSQQCFPSTQYSIEMTTKTRSRFLWINQHFFRQINVVTKEVTKRVDFMSLCGNYNLLSLFFDKTFVKITILPKEITK